MLAVDTTTTSGTNANTGIQRVTRELTKCLTNLCPTQPIRFDSSSKSWKIPEGKDHVRIFHQEDLKPSHRRGSRVTFWSTIKKLFKPKNSFLHTQTSLGSGFIEPEIFNNQVHHSLRTLLPRISGPSLAIYYDATPLTLPEFSTRSNTKRFPEYLLQLLQFDGIAAISESSKEELQSYWGWLGLKKHPIIRAIPLGVDLAHTRSMPSFTQDQEIKILCVGSIEGRKNQLSLLKAADVLWQHGTQFKLTLVGLASRSTGWAAIRLIKDLQKKGRPLEWLGPRSEKELQHQYAKCHFTVYPSISEGFGLPVLESLKHGKPCICSSQGAIGENSTKGGCLILENTNPKQIADAIERLLKDGALFRRLRKEARKLNFRTWSDYAKDILDFHSELNLMNEEST